MKCKKHLGDLSSSVGVCAPCLRDRLFVLIAAQAQADLEVVCDGDPDPRQHPHACRTTCPVPQVQQFHRQVSPPVGRHKKSSSCDRPVRRPNRRFFSTPQVGPTFSSNHNHASHDPGHFIPDNKPPRFSLLRLLLRKRSEEVPNPDPTSQPSSSSSIFSLWKKKKKKNQSQAPSITVSTMSSSDHRRKFSSVVSNRGMSPAEGGGSDEDEDQDRDPSPSNSGYSSSSSSSEDCLNRTTATSTAYVTPRRATTTTPLHPRSQWGGFAFCLSPLVRTTNPGGNWKNKGGMPGEAGYAGSLGDTAAFCKNRSRKLADFGRGAHRQ